MRFRTGGKLSATASAVVLAASLAACSSSGGSHDTGGSSGSTGPTTPNTSRTSSPSTDALKQLVDGYLSAPTGVGITTPLSRKPDTNKLVVGILLPIATAQTESAAQATAASALGWRYKTIIQGTGPQDAETAFESALALKPDGIIYYGTPRALIATGLAKAQAAGIPVVATAQVDPLAPPIIANNANSGAQLGQLGKGMADYVAYKSNGEAHVALFPLTAYPVLASFDEAFKTELASVCPGCKVSSSPVQLTDIGTKTPSAVANAVRADSKIKWAIFDCACASAAVAPGLEAAGINGVTIGGEAPLSTQIVEMKSGVQEAWAAISLSAQGYGLMDALARKFNGDSLDPVVDQKFPWQIVTTDTVGTALVDSKDNYVGYADYQKAFAALWKLS
jgi:ribose transport system substrate-binding protein